LNTAWGVGYVKRILIKEMSENLIPGSAIVGFMDTFWSYIYKQCGITKTVHILSCSVDGQSSSQGEEGLSVSSSTQATQTMAEEQRGTCGSQH